MFTYQMRSLCMFSDDFNMLFSFSVIQTTESLHRYPGALGRDHRGLLADAVGAQFHHRCDAHQAAWDGQSECLLIRHSDHKRNEDFILKTRVPASFLWNTEYSGRVLGHSLLCWILTCKAISSSFICVFWRKNWYLVPVKHNHRDKYVWLVLTLNVFLLPFALDKLELGCHHYSVWRNLTFFISEANFYLLIFHSH